MKKIAALFLCLCLALGCVSLALAEGKFIPGTYEGVAFGFGGDIKATVTVDEDAITAIELFGPDETAMLGGAALKTLEEAYIGKASATDVDTVVSATISSKGAQDAVAAALKKALANPEEDAPAADEVKEKVEYHFIPGTYEVKLRGMGGYMTIEVTFSEDTIEDFVVVKHTETPGIGTLAIEQVIPAMLEAQSPDVDGVTSATITSDALKNALRQAIKDAAAPEEPEQPAEPEPTEEPAAVAATYEAVSSGFAGDIKVTLTVEDGVITAIEIEGPDETPAIGGRAISTMKEAYIGKTSADDVDSVASATFTSNGVKEAVAKALAKAAAPAEEPAAAGTYEGVARGFGGDVKVTLTVENGVITAIEIEGPDETPAIGGRAISTMKEAFIGKTSADDVDQVSGATFTSDGVKQAVENALAAANGADEGKKEAVDLAFTAGEYTATAEGYNGPTTVKVTFSDSKIEAIEIVSTAETGHVGDVAFDIMIPEMIEANGSGVDGVSGATFSSRALRNAVSDAAEQAGCTDLDAFKSAKVAHEAGDPIEVTYDVVIVGAGGAGISAAAQAAQDGNTVLVIEKNAEVGGNTLVSGGQYQSVMPYLVWDPADPDATTGVYAFTGDTYDKVKSVQGCINELNMILNWSEEPFDEAYYIDHEFVAGDAAELSKHGVHAEYLPILQALKAEIREYFVWAAPQLATGKSESQLTLFSTLNLHIFQTYYGGLRQSADKSQWIYGDLDLVKQFIMGGQGLKEWLEAQGSAFKEDGQPTLIGALWYRENEYAGANVDFDGDGETEFYADRWGSYFMAPMNTVLKANEENQIMLRTTAESLIVEDGRVVGVNATRYDGTPVIAKATKGVILATGGYAANIPMVLENNVYWSEEYLTSSTKTTNRSSLQGDGIAMAQAVGADVTGMGFTQLMPISWVDNGNLAFGGGNYACWINPNTGHRFVDEGSERDVLSLAEFRNGMIVNGTPGVFLEIYNATERIPGPPSAQLSAEDYDGRYYHIKGTVEELAALFERIGGIAADPAVVLDTVKAYDQAVMGQGEFPDVGKAIASRCIGNVEKDANGNYLPDTYDLEGADLIVRLMAPSTHHTMGGVKVDTQRHVLNADGGIIPGLYAAGEVTGGIHGGNRLGGNAIVEIFVSGRTAAQAVTADNE